MITLYASELEGGMFQKMRLFDTSTGSTPRRESPLPRSPSLPPNEALAQRLCVFINWSDPVPGNEVHMHGAWLRELPQRFGTSVALDDAAKCLISSHESVVRGDQPSTWMDLKQYSKALQSLQKAIDDPNEQFSTNTVAAISLLWRLEGWFAVANGRSHKQAVHAKAMSTMLQARGIRDTKDPLEFLLLADCLIASVQYSLGHDIPRPCVFDSPDWDLNLDDHDHLPHVSILYWRLFRQYVKWPGLLHDIVKVYLFPNETKVTIQDILQRAISVAACLEELWFAIELVLQDPSVCITKLSTPSDPLVPLVYEFLDTEVAPLVGYYCFFTISIHRMIVYLSSILTRHLVTAPTAIDLSSSYPTSVYDSPAILFSPSLPLTEVLSQPFLAAINARNEQLAQNVWMMYEQTRKWKPVGVLFFVNALKISFPIAQTIEMKSWILNTADDLEDFMPDRRGWEPHQIERFCKMLAGEVESIEIHFSGGHIWSPEGLSYLCNISPEETT